MTPLGDGRHPGAQRRRQAWPRSSAAVGRQRVPGEVELLVCDSGSTDGSAELARRAGATVIEIAPDEFSHGRTRNLLMQRASARHVAFLTQDAVPADELWLSRLLAGFAAARRRRPVFGPYRPRPDASPMVARELTEWFAGVRARRPASDRPARRRPSATLPARDSSGARLLHRRQRLCRPRGLGARPFRDIAYAEDHALAHDMLRAGFAKVFPGRSLIVTGRYTVVGVLSLTRLSGVGGTSSSRV